MADRILRGMGNITRRLRPYVPFTVLNTVWRSLDRQAKSVLDLGCGEGEPMAFLNRQKGFYTVGVDIFRPYIHRCKTQTIHDEYVRADIRHLPFSRKSFDVVLCMEALEHLDKNDGEQLLQRMEETARRQVVISTPLGRYDQHAYDGNPYQEHRTIWTASELKQRGYRVQGHGVRGIGGREGLVSRLPRVIQPLGDVIWVMAGPFARFFPALAGHMVCVKRLPAE